MTHERPLELVFCMILYGIYELECLVLYGICEPWYCMECVILETLHFIDFRAHIWFLQIHG